MLSSSACKEPALAPSPPSAKTPELGCIAEELILALPLEVLSSSVLLPPPVDNLPLRWLKELLYFEMGAGLGDADIGEAIVFSDVSCLDAFREAGRGGGGGGISLSGCIFMGSSLVDGLRA